MKVLLVVDMQEDFTRGALGSEAAQAIIPKVKNLVESCKDEYTVIFTRDTHTKDYLNTQEGRYLPVEHCIKGTEGFEICYEYEEYYKYVVDKPTFGSLTLPDLMLDIIDPEDELEEIMICGLCTDICVISNAMILKAAFPEVPIYVDASCCAGVTEESHKNALSAMKSVQIHIINEEV